MMRRVVSLCLLTLVIAACSSTPPEKPEANPTSFVQRGAPTVDLPLVVPESTAMLARMDLPEVRKAWDPMVTLADETGAEFPEGLDPGRLAVAGVLSGPDGSSRASIDARSYSNGAFPGLDEDGTVYAAISTAGNETLLRAVELSAPAMRAQTPLRGVLIRVRIPATEPDTLASWLGESCEQFSRFCGDLVAVEVLDSAVRVDYRAGYRVGDPAEDAPLESPQADTEFVAKGSAALDSFLVNPAAIGLYLRSDRLADVGALLSMIEVNEALEGASPEIRDRAYARSVSLAGSVFEKLEPDVREVSDSMVFARAAGDAGFVIDAMYGLTERGVAASKAGMNTVDVTRPTAAEGLLEAEMAYDVSESRAAVQTPEWMRVGPERDGRDLMRSLRRGGVFGVGIAMHNYPIAFSRGMHAAALMQGGDEAMTMQQSEYLNAARLVFGLESSEDGDVGLTPVGGLTLSFDRRSDIDGWSGMVEAVLEDELDMPFTVTSKVYDDRKELIVGFGESSTVGEVSEVGRTVRARLDLKGLVDVMREVPEETSRGVELALPGLEQLGVLSVQSRRIEGVLHARMSLGDARNAALQLPADMKVASEPEPVEQCVRRAGAVSRDAMEALEKVTPDNRGRVILKIAAELAEIEADCDARAEDVRWARGIWLQLVGTVQAQSLRWSEAAQSYEKACELGVEYSCELVERGLRVDLPTVTSGFLNWDAKFGQLLKLSPDSLSRWAFSRGGTDESQSAVSLDGVAPDSESVGGEITSLISEVRGRTAYVVADAQASAYVLARLNVVERLPRDRYRDRYRPIVIKGPPERRLGVVLAARHQDDDRPVRLDYRVPEPVAPLEWRMVVGEQTIDIIRVTDDGTEQIAPVDGCPKDGPTFCKDADLAEMAAMPFVDSTDDQIVDFVAIDVVVERPTRVGRLVEVTDRAWALLQERNVTFYFKLSPAE